MYVCITLAEMGKRDNNPSRNTREFDPSVLAALTKQPLPDDAQVTDDEDSVLILARTHTLNDPMTTSLLAEVARRNQTQEFDDESIDKTLEDVDPQTNHPHTTRRAK